jgi:hypothetical protein
MYLFSTILFRYFVPPNLIIGSYVFLHHLIMITSINFLFVSRFVLSFNTETVPICLSANLIIFYVS